MEKSLSFEESQWIRLITPTEVEQRPLNTQERREVRPQNLKNKLSVYFFMEKISPRTTKSYNLAYISSTTWRQTFLMTEYPLHRRREKYIYDRSTTISPLYVGLRVNIYSGRKFYTKFVNKWMVGFKFGEFVWNRKLAMYKAKQLRKKKKKK